MNKKRKKEEITLKTSDVNEKDGISINYSKEELKEKFPNLISEIDHKEKVLKIEAVNNEFEEAINSANDYDYCEDLSNPGALDFIRRCKNNDEALEVLNYLLKRDEISKQDHNFIVKKINEEDGLKKLINACGGYKSPGYYVRKYYKNIRINNDDKTIHD